MDAAQKGANDHHLVTEVISRHGELAVEQLYTEYCASTGRTVSRPDFIRELRTLEANGSIELNDPPSSGMSYRKFMLSFYHVSWFYSGLFVTVATYFLTQSDLAGPLAVFRWVFASLDVALVPGLPVYRAFFSGAKRSFIEQIGISVALSIAVVALIGLALNFRPSGVSFGAIVDSLTLYNLIALVVASILVHLDLSAGKP